MVADIWRLACLDGVWGAFAVCFGGSGSSGSGSCGKGCDDVGPVGGFPDVVLDAVVAVCGEGF